MLEAQAHSNASAHHVMNAANLFELPFRDPALEPIRDKGLEGKRLTLQDGMVLFNTPDLPGLMRLADVVRRAIGLPAAEVLKRINTSVAQFMGAAPPFDDTTLVVIRRTGASESRAT